MIMTKIIERGGNFDKNRCLNKRHIDEDYESDRIK